jgi:hypothetical protein
MELSNFELKELGMGLMSLRNVKSEHGDSPERLAAKAVLGNRVGVAWRELRNQLEALEESEAEIAARHAKKIDGKPVAMLDDRGRPIGFEVTDGAAYLAERRPLLMNKVTIPEMKRISYDLLLKAGYAPDGELVAQLGSFLEGEPSEMVELQRVPSAG